MRGSQSDLEELPEATPNSGHRYMYILRAAWPPEDREEQVWLSCLRAFHRCEFLPSDGDKRIYCRGCYREYNQDDGLSVPSPSVTIARSNLKENPTFRCTAFLSGSHGLS